MHSHHTHSGDYVAHATDTLDGVTSRAIELGFETFCLTEHMPRLESRFLYPEELERGYTLEKLNDDFDKYCFHAKKIQKNAIENGLKTRFLVGFEVEGIDDNHINFAEDLKQRYKLDLLVGSVHFVNEIPIDFDRDFWEKSRDVSGGVRALFKDYFELQYKVLTKLKPEIVGHFDLIRLFSSPNDWDDTTQLKLKDIRLERDWPDVWSLIVRNLTFAKSYGALIEFNSAALRKNWKTPYPQLDVSQAVINYADGRFCLSDDSHSIAQVGLNYHKVRDYIVNDLKLKHIYYLDFNDENVEVKRKQIEEFVNSSFWQNYIES
ncbi:hypothetical protein WICMUC_002551 [Wickerhamomyces mucosus]|uniref:Histidinol-phosphatase n=1 Tax=Wickerhamomyces mucosus TaxID=1378264 RepID=A0A9P8TEA4_9ASCO|nr:hypothetical protein WICMUC_002551 [Wickerhamomyces mucosus]